MQCAQGLCLVKRKRGLEASPLLPAPSLSVGLQVPLRTMLHLPSCMQALSWDLEMGDTWSYPTRLPP